MFPKINPAETNAWKQLKEHHEEMRSGRIKKMFQEDPDRFSKFSATIDDIVFDYSKNMINEKTFELLLQLAEECKVKEAIEAMFNGDKINETENRSVLHVALRNFSKDPVYSEGKNVMPLVRKVLKQMKTFCDKVHSGEWRGYTGKKIRYIVNIGIGGSDLGPQMVTAALKPYWIDNIQAFFVSNVDGTHIAETLKKVKPERTLFLVASKTFTTQETMTNAHTAREWFLKKAKDEKHIAKHFAALSTNEKEVVKRTCLSFGIGSVAATHYGAPSVYLLLLPLAIRILSNC